MLFGKPRWTTILICALCAFLFGLVLARRAQFALYWFAPPLVLTTIGRVNRNRVLCALGFIMVLLCFGWWRGSSVFVHQNKYQDLYYKTVFLEAKATEDSVYSERKQLVFRANNISVDGQELIGNVEIEGFGEPMIYPGDVVKVQGKLLPRRGSLQAGIRFAEIEIISRHATPVDSVRRKFAAGLQNTLPEPLASFGLGLLIGQRSTLDEKIENELTAVGLIHIVAVSGYNLTVLTHLCQGLFSRRSRYQALVFSLVLVLTFLLFTGYSASIVRAAVVSILGLVTWYFGRRIKPLLLLLLPAAITAGVNPLYVWGDIGWYLSFTAFYGVLVVAPLVNKRVFRTNQPGLVPATIIETSAAQICTLPIILLVFGRLSVVGIIANVLVVPMVPVAMLLSLVAGIAGMVSASTLGFLALPAKLSLSYILEVSKVLTSVPYANVELKISVLQLALMYLLIVSITFVLWKRLTTNVKITEKKRRENVRPF